MVLPLCAMLGGCASVRENSRAQDAARAVLSAQAYDRAVDAARRNDDAALRTAIDDVSKYNSGGLPNKMLRLGAAELAVIAGIGANLSEKQWTQASVQERRAAEQKSAQHYRRALEISPDFPSLNPQLLNSLGYFLAEQGTSQKDFALAEKFTRRAVELYDAALKKSDSKQLRAERATTRDSLAWALYKLGKLDEAETQQREAIKESRATDAMSAELPLHLADILAKAGKTEAAKAAYKEALTLKQGEPDAHARARAALQKIK